MKPYGRVKKVTGGQFWKRDRHWHDKKHRKLGNWWEGICDFLSRTEIKRRWKNETENEIKDESNY